MNILEVIIFSISALGILLLCILTARAFELGKAAKLEKHRSKDEGFVDLLNYAAVVDDGVIVGKNGSLLGSFIYQCDDNASSTDEQRNLVSTRINQALSRLGTGWMVHIDAVRRPATDYPKASRSHFTDDVCQAIDEERRRLFESMDTMYEGAFIITFTWFPPMLAQRKFVELMFDDDMPKLTKSARTKGLIEQFKRELASIENSLSSCMRLTRLKSHKIVDNNDQQVTYDDLLAWLNYCVTGVSQPIQLPKNPMYIDSIIGGKDFVGGVIPKIGDNFFSVVSIDGFPSESSPGILTLLTEQNCEYRWSTRFIFLDPHESLEHFDKYRKKWKQKIRGFFDQVFNTATGAVDKDAVDMVDDAESAIADINSQRVAAGFYTSTIVIFDKSREQLDANTRLIEKSIQRLGFTARIENVNAMDAYFGSLPGHGVENIRRPLLNTRNLADLMPVSSIWTGLDHAPCPLYPNESPALMHCVTHGATPFRLNLHVGDVGHSFIFGPTGYGKSTLLATLVAQLRRYPKISIFAFDKGMSLYPLTKAIPSAKHFDVAGDEQGTKNLSFCPLQYLDTASDRAWATEWIETILALNDVIISPPQRNMIANSIESMASTGDTSFSTLVLSLQDNDLRDALKQYTVDGSMGDLLDAEHDGMSLSDFTVFEIENLLNLGDKYALPVLLYLFRRIEKSLKGQPAAIVLDEAWIMLGHKVFKEKIKEWLKVLRKANCMVIMATQNISDAANSGILDVIVESTATKIFLPNPNARNEEAADLYKRMGLNRRQIEIIATAIPKRQYYYVSALGRRLFELGLGKLTLAFVGATDKDSVLTIKELETKYGSQWVDHWLAMRDLSLDHFIRRSKKDAA